MRRAFAAINDLQLREWKLEAAGELFHGLAKLSLRKRRELVEERHDEDRIDGDAEDLDRKYEEINVVEEAVASLLNDGEEGTANRDTEYNAQRLSFEEVRDPKFEGLLVETILLFEHEVVVVVERKTNDCLNGGEGEEPNQAMANLPATPRWREACHPDARNGPQLWKHIVMQHRHILYLTEQT